MKGLELAIYLLFVLAIFLAFGLYLYSAIVLLIAFVLIDRVKKYDKDKAKKLNYIGIAIVAFIVILFLISIYLASTFVSGLLKMAMPTNLTNISQINNSNPYTNSNLPKNSSLTSTYYNSTDNTFYCKFGDNSACSALIENCTDSNLKLYGINIEYGSYSDSIKIQKNGQICKIVYNVTDANVTKEILLRNVSMICNLPISNGKIIEGMTYCQFYDVLLTPIRT